MKNFRSAFLVLTLCATVFAYLPGERSFPSLPNSNGLFGNPAGLSAFDSPGALLNFGRTKSDIYEISTGFHGNYLGASFEYRSDYEAVDESRWNLVGSLPFFSRFAFWAHRGTPFGVRILREPTGR